MSRAFSRPPRTTCKAAAKEPSSAGLEVEIITKSPATHTAFADQVGIIEGLISRRVNVIQISPTKAEVVKPALGRAAVAGTSGRNESRMDAFRAALW